MAQFSQWALEYVLSDDETVQSQIAKSAAREIESSRASSTAVGNWAASVQQWMTPASANDDDQLDDGDEGPSGDIIARAKALGFLAGTLEALDKATLKSDQVLRLVGFFGAMFSYDHKAGITASAKALRQLYAMKSFKPDMGVKILDDVCKIKEDFRLQTAATRLEIYELFRDLIQDPAVSSELKHRHGASCGFAVDLLQLCQSERDPRNLMIWFRILALILADYDPSPEVTEEVFKVFSAYFPISLRSSATPIGITAEDLKEAVRACFSAHQRVAKHAFPFLLQKLDQGDAVTVAVKVDILKTMRACIDKYESPHVSIVPHVDKIWNSLKYEVRNGEVKETIDATLDVLRSIAGRLDGTRTQKFDVSLLRGYADLVSKDCRDDLANPTYTKQSGLLLMTVTTANIRAYVLYNASFVDAIRQNLRQPKSPSHARDLLLLLNSLLKTRMELLRDRTKGHPDDEEQLRREPRAHLDTLFHDVYLPIWTAGVKEHSSEEKDVLKQVAQGLALLVSQQVLPPDGGPVLLCSASVCSDICSLLTLAIARGLSLSANDNDSEDTDLEDEAVLALRTIVSNYTAGYAELVGRVIAEIRKRDWNSPSEHLLTALKDLLSRVTFIGCSEIPSDIAQDAPTQPRYSPLQHFITLTSNLIEVFPLAQTEAASRASAYVISSLHASILWFRDACAARFGNEVLSPLNSDQNWFETLHQLPQDWFLQIRRDDEALEKILSSPAMDASTLYRQFLKLSLIYVAHLYRLAVYGPQEGWSDLAFFQLSEMTAQVVRNLAESLQITCRLADAAFDFFGRPGWPVVETGPSEVSKGLLTLGILKALRPGAMKGLYDLDGRAERAMCNTSLSRFGITRESDVRAAMGCIFANKYTGGPSTSDPEGSMMKRVFGFWEDWLTEATTSSTMGEEDFQAHITVAMHVMAGAAARRDKHLLDIVPALHSAVTSLHPHGEFVAKVLGLIVKDLDLLKADSHAVVKPLYKQWVYTHLARPLLLATQPRAAAAKAEPHFANRCRVAVLSVVRRLPFAVYQDDLHALVRLLVRALKLDADRDGLAATAVVEAQVAWALEILVAVLEHEPAALRSYLWNIVSDTCQVYRELGASSRTSGSGSGSGSYLQPAVCRKLAMRVLGAIPTRFEERDVWIHSFQALQVLGLACGDRVRQVRELAIVARRNWARVAR